MWINEARWLTEGQLNLAWNKNLIHLLHEGFCSKRNKNIVTLELLFFPRLIFPSNLLFQYIVLTYSLLLCGELNWLSVTCLLNTLSEKEHSSGDLRLYLSHFRRRWFELIGKTEGFFSQHQKLSPNRMRCLPTQSGHLSPHPPLLLYATVAALQMKIDHLSTCKLAFKCFL